jgi:PKD repeat protein/photosystem II stability/assembly factor-like uncharacterized protein
MKKLYIILVFTFISQIFYGQWSVANIGSSGYSYPLFSVEYFSPNEIWIGSDGGIFKSSNGGLSWSNLKSIGVNGNGYGNTQIYDVRAFGIDTAVFVGNMQGGSKQVVLKTYDGGNTWQTPYYNYPFPINSSYKALDVFGNKMIAMGNNCGSAYSSDFGNSWSIGGYTNGFDVLDVEYANHDTLICITDHRILYSHNGGFGWIFAITPLNFSGLDLENFHNVSCYKNVSYVTSSTNKLFKSTDFGSNYTIIDLPTIDSSLSMYVKAVNKDTLLFSDNEGLYLSKSGGKYWEKFIIPNFKKINMIDVYGTNKVVAVGNLGYVLQNQQIYTATTLPKSNFSIPFNPLSYYCGGNSIVLNNLTDSTAGYTYKWLLNDTLFSSQYHATVYLNSISDINKISLVTSNVNGSDTLTRKVLVYGHDLKNFTIITNSDSACQGSISDFSILNSQVGVNYQLRKGFTNIGVPKIGNGSTLKFYAAVGTASLVTFNIIAIKSNTCFTDSLIKYSNINTGQSTSQYCSPSGASMFNDGIINFNLNTINNFSSAESIVYSDYSCFRKTSLVLGANYNYSLTKKSNYSPNYFKIWIDLDSNGVFDINELIVDSAILSSAQTINGIIKIPDSARVFYSKLRMRIGLSTYQYFSTCGSFYGAEYQDYSVIILPAPVLPASNFSFTSTVECSSTFKFKNTSTNSISYLWDFGDGVTSNLKSPTHVYGLVGGNFNVKLIAFNPYGSDTILQSIFNLVPQTPMPNNCITSVGSCGFGSSLPTFYDVYILGFQNSYLPSNYQYDLTCIRQFNLFKDSLYFMGPVMFSSASSGNFTVYIDYNNDGTFTINENALNGTNYYCSPSSGCLMYLNLDNRGLINTALRMRVISHPNYFNSACGQICGDYRDVTVFLHPKPLGSKLRDIENSENQIKISPNPSNGKFKIISASILGEVVIYNILGEIVFKFTSNQFSESIDISKQPKGTYIIKINNSFRKILVE